MGAREEFRMRMRGLASATWCWIPERERLRLQSTDEMDVDRDVGDGSGCASLDQKREDGRVSTRHTCDRLGELGLPVHTNEKTGLMCTPRTPQAPIRLYLSLLSHPSELPPLLAWKP